MGGTAIEVDVLPAQAAQFPLAHGGLQRQLHHRQQPAIARLAPAGDVNAADPGDKPVGEGMAHHQAQAVGFGLGTGLEGPGLQRVACWTGCPNAAEPRDGQERPGRLIDQSLAL